MPWTQKDLAPNTATADFNTTKQDMEAMYKWQHGDTVYGTFAKSRPAWKRLRNDIDRAWGKEDDNKDLYIDTLSRKLSVGDQLKKWRK